MSNTINLFIDGHEITVPKGSTVKQACEQAGKEIPHFCYHERLSIAGNCRMCLVEVEGAPKPVASCHWPVAEGMKIRTDSQVTMNARKGTMEFLLANHPLDCPICDQGGECELQDQAVAYGSDRTHFNESKRAVDDKEIGAKIKTVMTRCIHCTRCIRFATEIAGVEEMGATGRGEAMQVGTYVEKALQSELAGNMIDLCPVGALTSKPYAYTARPWELQHTESIDVMDAMGSHINVDTRAGEVMRITPREAAAINEEWLADTGRFSYDGLTNNRLTNPMINNGKKLQSTTWDNAFNSINAQLKRIKNAKSSKKIPLVAGVASALHSAEDLYAFNAFMRTALDTPHVDARPLGMQFSYGSRAEYTCMPFADMENADVILLVGVNPRLEMPVLNARLRQKVRQGKLKIARIGDVEDLTYPCTELGNSPHVLEDILAGTHRFCKVLNKAKNPLVLVGAQHTLVRNDSLLIMNYCMQLAEKYNALREDWCGISVLHPSAGSVAVLDMDVVPHGKGKTAREILVSTPDILVVYGDGNWHVKEVQKAKFIIYIGTHNTALAQCADVVLPAAAYTEKPGLWTNNEGRVQEAFAATKPPLNAKEDWKIFRALSAVIGKTLPFDALTQLRQAIVAKQSSYATIGAVEPRLITGQIPTVSGKLLASPFTKPITQFYLTNEILDASTVMHACQAEQDVPEQKKVAA